MDFTNFVGAIQEFLTYGDEVSTVLEQALTVLFNMSEGKPYHIPSHFNIATECLLSNLNLTEGTVAIETGSISYGLLQSLRDSFLEKLAEPGVAPTVEYQDFKHFNIAEKAITSDYILTLEQHYTAEDQFVDVQFPHTESSIAIYPKWICSSCKKQNLIPLLPPTTDLSTQELCEKALTNIRCSCSARGTMECIIWNLEYPRIWLKPNDFCFGCCAIWEEMKIQTIDDSGNKNNTENIKKYDINKSEDLNKTEDLNKMAFMLALNMALKNSKSNNGANIEQKKMTQSLKLLKTRKLVLCML